jgi:cob(I)alamin adenosyltransferase
MKAPTAFQGRVQVYTGDGKGKTTAALGLALRAAGHGFATYFGQFLKGRPTGEQRAALRLSPLLTIEQFGRKGFLRPDGDPDQEDVDRARRGLARCLRAMRSGRYRIVVFDEINVAVDLGLLTVKEVFDVLDLRPADVEVVLTGRGAPSAFLRRADLVTDMKERKHYSSRGLRARAGIES